MLKKITLLMLLLLLAACGGEDSEESESNSDAGNNEGEAATLVPTVEVPEPSVDAAALPEGTFTVLLTGHSEQAIEENKMGQDNRNQDEHVLTLVDRFSGFGVTLYFPFNIEAGTYPLSPYIPAHSEGRVSATVTTLAAGFFYAQGGVLIVDSVENGLITGRFSFTSTVESSGRIYNAQGGFNKIPLKAD